ncbi:MAG: Hpt domain-containing protein [Flavobacterium sp.]|jgi:hypothetical protein
MEIPNLNYIDDLSRDDLEFKKKIIEILKKEISSEKEIYQNCIEKLDYKKTAEIVHKLKNKISITGLKKGYIIAENFENSLNNESVLYKNEFEEVLLIMENYINNL